MLGGHPPGISDLYHWLLRITWSQVFALIAAAFVLINLLFALGYYQLGGVTNAAPNSFSDAFFFSVQTFGTIGYGAMYPQSTSAHLLVTAEAFASLVLNALMTGLVFAKFARPTSRVLWSNVAVINDREGVPTLMFRVANERINHIVEATVRVAILRAEKTLEGELVRRVVDLPLARQSTPSFLLTWTVMHHIGPQSPLYGATLESLHAQDVEIVITLTGLDENLGQTIYARHSYIPEELVFAARFDDVIRADPQEPGRRLLDYTRFHTTVPAPLSWAKLGLKPPTAPLAPETPAGQ